MENSKIVDLKDNLNLGFFVCFFFVFFAQTEQRNNSVHWKLILERTYLPTRKNWHF